LNNEARAMNCAIYHVETTMTDRLKAMPYTSELWKERYPRLVNILADEPAATKGNLVARNLSGGGRWDDVTKVARPYVTFENNHVAQDGVHLEAMPDAARLQADALANVPAFQPIPLTKIGLYPDQHRTTLPPT
ncbi:MAG: hypothetical protein JSW27_13560, partial [Phycisphaerales bacterium]